MKKKPSHKKGRDQKWAYTGGDEDEKPAPDFPIKLCIWDFKQCDPKKCTGAKLKRAKYVESITVNHSYKGIVLT